MNNFDLPECVLITEPKPTVSSNYSFIRSADIVDQLTGSGFQLTRKVSVRGRTPESRRYGKHLLAFRHPDAEGLTDPRTGQRVGIPEVLFGNSSDGRGALILRLGVYTLVCSNGLIIGVDKYSLRLIHTNLSMELVQQYVDTFMHSATEIQEKIDTFHTRKLEWEEQISLAKTAISLRWGEEGQHKIAAEKLLIQRRRVDFENDLWTTYNVIQENVMQGGVPGITAGGRRTRTRRVNELNAVKFNVDLWNAAELML